MKKTQAAFAVPGKMLKGGLHCHSTRSDGRVSPEEVIATHKANGYAFMALTDHRLYNYDNFGVDGITILPSTELDANFKKRDKSAAVHCHHLVCIGPVEGNGFKQNQTFERVFIDQPEETQALIDMVHENNNLTIYAHPQWSGTPSREFEMLRGNFDMEVWNSGCALTNRLDTNAAYWDELLAQGQKIYGVATDDAHIAEHLCRGWVMVRAENNVPAILEALKNGAFYASCGPEIYDFYVEDGEAHIACSPVAEINFHHLRTPFKTLYKGEGELTQGSMKLRAGGYIRASVTDENGLRAWTNPIFLEDSDLT